MAEPGFPIEGPRGNLDPFGIDFDKLPQLPFWRIQEDLKASVAGRLTVCTVIAGRELTQPEKNALAQHYALMLRNRAYDTPLALIATLSFYRYTYKSYGFPMYTPKPPKFNPSNFWGLKGPLATTAWHGLRAVAWYTVCKPVATIFCLSFALSSYTARSASDPRLVDYRRSVQARSRQQGREGRQRDAEKLRHLEDLAERTGSLFSPEVQSRAAAPTSWSSTEHSTQDTQSEWSGTQSPQPETSQSSYNDEPNFFDDASPVAPAEQQSDTTQQSSQGFSAWDRIRGQARSKGASQGQRAGEQASAWGRKRNDELTSRGAQDGTSYTYSSADEEKAYAKEQAQKEFDQMLDKERRGGSDASRRW